MFECIYSVGNKKYNTYFVVELWAYMRRNSIRNHFEIETTLVNPVSRTIQTYIAQKNQTQFNSIIYSHKKLFPYLFNNIMWPNIQYNTICITYTFVLRFFWLIRNLIFPGPLVF